MKSISLDIPFATVIKLVMQSSSQDIMLINETSPAMVRFLCKDNRFRTFQLTRLMHDGEETNIKLTKSDDPEITLKELRSYIRECAATKGDVTLEEEEKIREERLKEARAEAIAHREALAGKKEETPENSEAKAEAVAHREALLGKIEESITSGKPRVTKKKKVAAPVVEPKKTKKKVARKTKKKVSKKKATKKKK